MIAKKQGDVRYVNVTPRHRDRVLELLTDAFVNEPSSAGSTLRPPDRAEWRRFTEFFMDECTTNGLSLAAVDAGAGGDVVGAFINRDFLRPLPPGLQEFIAEPSPFAPLLSALAVIDEVWFDRHPEIDRSESGRVCDLWMLGVDRNRLGRGIAKELTRRSLDRVAEAGFEYAVIEATGAFSQKAMEDAGCRTVASLSYDDFLWKGEAVFARVPPPHRRWVMYEKALKRPHSGSTRLVRQDRVR